MSRRSVSPHRGAGLLRARYLPLSLALGLALGATAIAAPASATPQSDLASKTAQAKRLQTEIDANSNRADALDEQFLQAQNSVAAANQHIAVAERNIAASEKQEKTLQARIGSRAALLYMGAGSGDPLGIDATNVQELGSRAKYGEAAAQSDDRMINQLTVLDEQLHRETQDLQKQKSDAQHRQSVADAARKQVAQINSQMQQLLASTNSDIKALANKIEQQQAQAQAAAEQARIRAEEAQQQAAANAAAQNTNTGGSGGALSVDTGVSPGNIPAPSAGAAAAVAYARAQLGKPYVYAGTGPGAFDCSGLTMMAWAQGGVGMTHGSQAQYDDFPKVPISDLQPGDLVFFGISGPDNHHVGIYVGGGEMIEAPHTGAFVRYSTIYRPDLVPLGSRP